MAYDVLGDLDRVVRAAWDGHTVQLDDPAVEALACGVHRAVALEAVLGAAGVDRDCAARAQDSEMAAPWGWVLVVAASDYSPARARPFRCVFCVFVLHWLGLKMLAKKLCKYKNTIYSLKC